MAACMEPVIVSAYMMTCPSMCRAARPIVCIKRPSSADSLLCRRPGWRPGYLRQVESFAQQVDAHDDVVYAQPQVAQYLDALQRIYFRVQVVCLDAHLQQVVGQFLRHALGQRGHQAALSFVHPRPYLLQQVVYLPLGRLDFDGRLQQAGGPDQLLDYLLAVLVLVRRRASPRYRPPG